MPVGGFPSDSHSLESKRFQILQGQCSHSQVQAGRTYAAQGENRHGHGEDPAHPLCLRKPHTANLQASVNGTVSLPQNQARDPLQNWCNHQCLLASRQQRTHCSPSLPSTVKEGMFTPLYKCGVINDSSSGQARQTLTPHLSLHSPPASP